MERRDFLGVLVGAGAGLVALKGLQAKPKSKEWYCCGNCVSSKPKPHFPISAPSNADGVDLTLMTCDNCPECPEFKEGVWSDAPACPNFELKEKT